MTRLLYLFAVACTVGTVSIIAQSSLLLAVPFAIGAAYLLRPTHSNRENQ